MKDQIILYLYKELFDFEDRTCMKKKDMRIT